MKITLQRTILVIINGLRNLDYMKVWLLKIDDLKNFQVFKINNIDICRVYNFDVFKKQSNRLHHRRVSFLKTE